jgi:GNAT superfamily N-acetyltransferase
VNDGSRDMDQVVQNVVLRALEDADVPAAAALMTASLGAAPGGVDREALFRWKHLANPFGRSIAFVAELDGEIVGLRTFMRWRFARSGQGGEVLAVRAVDTATSPLVQRRGVFSRLTTRALDAAESEGVAFVFNTPNERSLPGYLKLGWHRLADRKLRARVRRPDRLIRAAASRDLGSGAATAPPTGSQLVPVEEFFADPASVAPFARAQPAPGRLSTPRWEGYLRWRYVAGPLPYAGLAEGSPPAAVAIVRLRGRGSLREAIVCEAVCEPGAESALRRLLARVPSAAGADHAVTHVDDGWPAARVLSRAGYLPLPRVGMHFVVRTVSPTRPDPLEDASWGLTLGDLELF